MLVLSFLRICNVSVLLYVSLITKLFLLFVFVLCRNGFVRSGEAGEAQAGDSGGAPSQGR